MQHRLLQTGLSLFIGMRTATELHSAYLRVSTLVANETPDKWQQRPWFYRPTSRSATSKTMRTREWTLVWLVLVRVFPVSLVVAELISFCSACFKEDNINGKRKRRQQSSSSEGRHWRSIKSRIDSKTPDTAPAAHLP